MPRSPSRDLAERFAGPTVGSRVPYFRSRNSLENWKRWLSLIALAAVLFWAAVSFFSSRFNYQLTHGPLANVHAPWDSQCEACHRPNDGKAGWLNARDRWHDFTCEICHASTAVHHESMKDEFKTEACSACHHDHNGRNFSLTRLSDHHCVRCHDNLAAATTKGQTEYTNKVTSFVGDHPEFRTLAQRPSSLKFSHSQHLTPGMVLQAGAKGKTLHGIEQYRKPGQSLDDLVQLDCNSCHTPDREGKYYQPIRFEIHCKACHPTTVPPTPTSRGTVVKAFDVPHGLSLEATAEEVEKSLAVYLQSDHPKLSESPKVRDLRPSQEPAMKAFTDEVKAAAAAGIKTLTDVSCKKCHEVGEQTFPGPMGQTRVRPSLRPTAIPEVWMPHARFDHSAHKAYQCSDCHSGAKAQSQDGRTIVNEREPVDIKGLASCRECHKPHGVARHDCTECHTYHGGDHGLRIRGPVRLGLRP